MVNPEHLKVLNQGIDAWNQWREDNPTIKPDLISVNLQNEDLAHVNLQYADLKYADLMGSELQYTNLQYVNLQYANLQNTYLTGSELQHINLQNANLAGSELKHTNLQNADLQNVDLLGSFLEYADLQNADLQDAKLFITDLRNAILIDANFQNAELIYTNLQSANLAGTDFNNSLLSSTFFIDTNLDQAKNLKTCRYLGPSFIDCHTLISSKNLPKKFFQGIGLSLLFIDYLPSFQGETWQFLTCFISYSEKDDKFSKKLYKSLQKKEIRCWRWREDAPWGGKVREEIDQAIFNYDKLIIICSENSLNSPQVIREIERAIQKEDELKKENPKAKVLFPINIDNYIFTKWDHYLKSYLVEYIIGDFRELYKPQKYSKSLNRLVNNLKKEN